MKQLTPFHVKTSKVETKPGCWSHTLVEIFEGPKKIGEYIRKYSGFGEQTFCPFYVLDRGWFALYSKDYTRTDIMSLPDCNHLGGEEPEKTTSGFNLGFCPVDYYVPFDEYDLMKRGNVRWGFVSGCVWGDDSSWKIQLLDLKDCDKGIIKRINMFPDCEYFNGRLSDVVKFEDDGEDYPIGVMVPKYERVELVVK